MLAVLAGIGFGDSIVVGGKFETDELVAIGGRRAGPCRGVRRCSLWLGVGVISPPC